MLSLNRVENEFPSLREFNDYLETVESLSKLSTILSFIKLFYNHRNIVFNLANNIDEDESLKKVEELKKEAKESAKTKHRVNYSFYYHLISNFFNIKIQEYNGID